MEKIKKILAALGVDWKVESFEPFRAEEDGRPYEVWKLETDRGPVVLKKTTPMERSVYETFFRETGPGPEVYAFGTYEDEIYMLMEFFPGSSMSRCTRERLVRTLEVLTESQRRWWGDETHEDVGYGFPRSWPNRCKRREYLGDLAPAYQAYLDAFASVPRTLCNDDLLPFNVLADEGRAVILDWEYAGILPYPCALARFLAFGEEAEGLFRMSADDRQFALDYYYENLIREKGISRAEFDRTMDLFFLKEYTEWVYCAALSGDFEMENYKKYSVKARELARTLGLF
jgi:hypothetical protein